MNFRRLLLVSLVSAGLVFAGSSSIAKQKMIQVKGSDTLVNLVQILTESYMEQNPKTPIAVLGGGSGTGIAALINGTCEIADHSRPWKEKEINLAKQNSVEPRRFIIAVDGLSVVVNENNSVKDLTMEQIGAIYRGQIKNWKEVGGPNKSISLYGRQSNSGTYVFFQEHVLGNKNYSPDMKRMNGNAQIVEGVIQDKAAIGYVGVGYVYDQRSGTVRKGLRVLKVAKDGNSAAYSPLDKAAVDTGKYPVARPLFQSTNGKPTGAILDFIKFETGPEGQKIVEREGFFTIGSVHVAENKKNLM
jgi:phosphate transport system substrate-binding protein